MDEAMEEAADVLEAVARRRALIGSDTLLIFMLKAVRPEKSRERYEVQHKEPTTVVEYFRAAAMKQMEQDRQKRLAEGGAP